MNHLKLHRRIPFDILVLQLPQLIFIDEMQNGLPWDVKLSGCNGWTFVQVNVIMVNQFFDAFLIFFSSQPMYSS